MRHSVGHVQLGSLNGGAVLRRVQHIDEHHRSGSDDLEIDADALAKGVCVKVGAVAHSSHRLRVALHQQGGVARRRRVVQHIHRGRADNDLQARRPQNGGNQLCGLLLDVYAMLICHSLLSSCCD